MNQRYLRCILIMLSLFLSFTLVQAVEFTRIYNFSGVSDGISAITCDATSIKYDGDFPPAQLPPSCKSGYQKDVTNNNSLDLLDNATVIALGHPLYNTYQYFVFNTTGINASKVTGMQATLYGKKTVSTVQKLLFFTYAPSSSNWSLLEAQTTAATNTRNLTFQGFVPNGSSIYGNNLALLWTSDVPLGYADKMQVDYVEVVLKYSPDYTVVSLALFTNGSYANDGDIFQIIANMDNVGSETAYNCSLDFFGIPGDWTGTTSQFIGDIPVSGSAFSLFTFTRGPTNASIITGNLICDNAQSFADIDLSSGSSSGGSFGNPFDQDLNTTSNVKFNNLTVMGNITGMNDMLKVYRGINIFANSESNPLFLVNASTGRVGIGVANPTAPLHVAGNIRNSLGGGSIVHAPSASGLVPTSTWTSSGGSRIFIRALSGGQGDIQTVSTPLALNFLGNNVLIGSPGFGVDVGFSLLQTPAAKLSVNGNVSINGTFLFQDSRNNNLVGFRIRNPSNIAAYLDMNVSQNFSAFQIKNESGTNIIKINSTGVTTISGTTNISSILILSPNTTAVPSVNGSIYFDNNLQGYYGFNATGRIRIG